MAKYVCSVCGYVYEGDEAPEQCPVCKAPAEKFVKQEGDLSWASEHVVGVAQGAPEDIIADLRANFNGECSEVGMYLAMARVAHREGYPEIGLYWEKAAYEEAEHAAKFAELLGEVITDSTKKNLEMRIEAEMVQQQERLTLQREQKHSTLMQSMTQSMKWQETKLATAKLSKAFIRDTLVKLQAMQNGKITLCKFTCKSVYF